MIHLRNLSLLISLAFLTSCASTRIPGQYANVSVSPGYSGSAVHSIGILPLITDGKPGELTSHLTNDRLATRLLDLGFRVIDPSKFEARARERNIDLTKPLRDDDLHTLSESLGVDAFVMGSISWNYVPAHSETDPEMVQSTHTEIKEEKDRNGKTRNDTTIVQDNVPTVRQSSTEGQYVTVGESIKLVSASTGEILISGYVPSGYYDMTDEIVDAIKQRLFPPKQS